MGEFEIMRRNTTAKTSLAKVVQLVIIFLLSFSLINVFSVIRGLAQQDDLTYFTGGSDKDVEIATDYDSKNEGYNESNNNVSSMYPHTGKTANVGITIDKTQMNFKGNITSKSRNPERKKMIDCPDGTIAATDVLYPRSMTHEGRQIPRVIHFIVPTKCFPSEINENLQQWLDLQVNYTVLFHDQIEIDNFLSTDRTDLPHISNAAKCAIEPLAKLDLAR